MFRGREKLLGVILILINCIGISGKSVLIPMLYNQGYTAEEIIIARLVYSTPVFWLVFFIFAPKRDRRLPNRKELAAIAGLSIISTVPLVSHTFAYGMMSASITSVLVYMFPVLVVLYERLFFKIKPGRSLLFALPQVYFGIMLLVLGGAASFSVSDWRGVAVTVLAAITFALYVTLQSHAYAPRGPIEFSPMTFTAWASLITPTVVIAALAPQVKDASFLFRPEATGLLIMLATFTTAVPFLALVQAIQYLGASLAALISAITPAINVIATAVFLGEILEFNQYLGVGLVILGLITLRAPKSLLRFGASPDSGTAKISASKL